MYSMLPCYIGGFMSVDRMVCQYGLGCSIGRCTCSANLLCRLLWNDEGDRQEIWQVIGRMSGDGQRLNSGARHRANKSRNVT